MSKYKIHRSVHKNQMLILQISTSSDLANIGPISMQSVLKSEWWDLSAYEISCSLPTVRYTAVDDLTWNDA